MPKSPIIYEAHIGMATEEQKVGSFNEFRAKVLPRIISSGYNTIQLMAIQEHPYYGSFGYHVSNFYSVSSRFGTPEDLKALIDEAHKHRVAVIMDLVHSHAVKNEMEGLSNFDGDPSQYFLKGPRREHVAWDSLCFDYGKDHVLHFLLSNCRYWLEEYQFDGFRFDGVTSMLYYDHGLGRSFDNYEQYYDGGQDGDAIIYLTLANEVIHQTNPNAITIAEEMSGMPGLAEPFQLVVDEVADEPGIVLGLFALLAGAAVAPGGELRVEDVGEAGPRGLRGDVAHVGEAAPEAEKAHPGETAFIVARLSETAVFLCLAFLRVARLSEADSFRPGGADHVPERG